jgi:hypothetical protein
MRVALCFFGLVGGRVTKTGNGEGLDPAIAYEYYKKHLLDINDEVDIFIHSWSYKERDKLLKLYKPIKSCIEEQMDFPQAANHPEKLGSFKNKAKLFIRRVFNNKEYIQEIKRLENYSWRTYSRWYSSKKAIALKSEYEKENNFKYDTVMITRLDVGFFTDLDFSKYDMNYFYASNRNDAATKEHDYQANYKNHCEGIEFMDLWFFSNSDNMDKFAKLYDEIESYKISPHRSSKQHVDKFIGKDKVKYTLYRWFDHEMIRRKFFEAQE